MSEEPPGDMPFRIEGAPDMPAEDFVYYKTPGGHWLGVGEDKRGRHFMVDEVGDLYYDTGSQKTGIYVVRTSVCVCIVRAMLFVLDS
jgi:hypothetical protein